MAWYNQQGQRVTIKNNLFTPHQLRHFNRMRERKGVQAARAWKRNLAEQAGWTKTPPTAEQPSEPENPTPAAPPTIDFQGHTGESTFTPPYEFKRLSDFLPQSVDEIQTTPMYNWRLQQANEALDRRLAAQGLGGSGAEIRNAADLTNRLTQEEAARLDKFGQLDAQRYDVTMRDLADRQRAAGQDQWQRLTDLMTFYGQQNPMAYAYSGGQGIANTWIGQGNTLANILGGQYIGQLPAPYVPQPGFYPSPVPPPGYIG